MLAIDGRIMRRRHRAAGRSGTNRLASTVVRTTVVAAALAAIAIPAAAQMRGEWVPDAGHLARTAAHAVGIVGGTVIVYYADDIRRRTAGSTVGAAALLTELGTLLFVLVFADMEVGHVFGGGLWSGAMSTGVTRLWWMAGLAAMVTLYMLSYRTLVKDIGGG